MASEVGRRQPCRTEPSTCGTGRNRQVDSAGKVPGHPAGGAELFSVGKKNPRRVSEGLWVWQSCENKGETVGNWVFPTQTCGKHHSWLPVFFSPVLILFISTVTNADLSGSQHTAHPLSNLYLTLYGEQLEAFYCRFSWQSEPLIFSQYIGIQNKNT